MSKIDDENSAEHQHKESEARHREEQNAGQIGVRMFAGRGYVDAAHLLPAAVDRSLDICDHSLDVVFVKPVLSDEDIELIESQVLLRVGPAWRG